MERYLLIESNNDNTSLIDLQSLTKSIDGMYRNTKGSFSNFISISKNKFGISSSKDVSTKIPKWLKMSEYTAVSTAFLAFVFKAIDGAKLFMETFSKSFQSVSGPHTLGMRIGFLSVTVVCIFLSYVMIKVWKLVKNQDTKTRTESLDHTVDYQTLINETNIITINMYKFIEMVQLSESSNLINKFNSMLTKATDLCTTIFLWLKEKFKSGITWVKKHPYITLALLIVIGFVFYAKFGKAATIQQGGNTSIINNATTTARHQASNAISTSLLSMSPNEAANIIMKANPQERVNMLNNLMEKNPENYNKIYDIITKSLAKRGINAELVGFFKGAGA